MASGMKGFEAQILKQVEQQFRQDMRKLERELAGLSTSRKGHDLAAIERDVVRLFKKYDLTLDRKETREYAESIQAGTPIKLDVTIKR